MAEIKPMTHIYKGFPIIIMTRNDGRLLKKCVDSILKTVTIDVCIYIVDNNSNETEHLNVLKELNNIENVKIILNNNNLWVLGVNKTIENVKKDHECPYFFLTDADIDFSNCIAKPCWLTYLIKRMDENISLGKIGISLSWDYLIAHKELEPILRQEKNLYSELHKIDDLYVSFVDTTATIFRSDWSIDPSSGLYPDHMRYLRPELYSCRTPKNIVVEHLGWYLYNNSQKLSRQHINEKIKCFTLVGGDVKSEILKVGDRKYQLFYKIMSKIIRRMWFFRRYYFLFTYILKHGIIHFDGQGYIATNNKKDH
ncbi:glycosyltransferase [Citrobacter farmeri]|nr:glycosyltransferase [Citrobacter farmeri]